MNSHVQPKKYVCSLCASSCHNAHSCPLIEPFFEEAKAIHSYGKPSSNSPFSHTYNTNWQNHPNFAWRQN